MIDINENIRYELQDEVAIEDFKEGSLLLLCRQLKLIEINPTARRILELMDGKRAVKQVIESISRDFGITTKKARTDILKLIDEMGNQGILKPMVTLIMQGRQKMDNKSSFMANPDVSLREENGDGAILFNADTEALLIINPVGQLIWKFLTGHPRTQSDVINHIKEMCEDVPPAQINTDVKEFMEDLYKKGFIGEAVDEKKS